MHDENKLLSYHYHCETIDLSPTVHWLLRSFLESLSFAEFFLDEGAQVLGGSGRRGELDDLALGVEDELGEVPGDHLGGAGLLVVQLAVVPEVDEEGVGVFAVDFDLAEDGEIGVEVFLHELLDLGLAAVLLAEELVAGESQDLESAAVKLVVHLRHLLVVGRSESSLACHIDHHDHLPALELVEVDHVTVDVLHLEVEEAVGHLSGQGLVSFLENCLTD